MLKMIVNFQLTLISIVMQLSMDRDSNRVKKHVLVQVVFVVTTYMHHIRHLLADFWEIVTCFVS